jgi:hypothetical protein
MELHFSYAEQQPYMPLKAFQLGLILGSRSSPTILEMLFGVQAVHSVSSALF